jgi:1,2-diacylglycerol 3-alpha-glucosyltransferase
MNIGIVTTWFERGAAYVSRQYREALTGAHEVFIYARGGESYAKNDKVWDDPEVKWGKRSYAPVSTGLNIRDFKKWVIENKIELVFFNEQKWWQPVVECNKMGIKTGAYIDYYTEETIPLFGIYDFLICNTKRHYSAFRWHKGAVYIPWGTNVELFKPESFEPVKKGFVTFFHSCGMSPERKGTEFILKAFPDLSGNAKLIIHSQIKLKEFYHDLKSVIEKLENEGKLEIIEKTVTAPGLYHLGDVYLYPTVLEGIGLTIAEAASCGLPVVTSDNGPMNEFVTSENGKLVKIDKYFSRADGYYWPLCNVDVVDLTLKMQYYIDNVDRIKELKSNAREYAEKNLSWQTNSGDLPNIFQNVKINPEKFRFEEEVIGFDKSKANFVLKMYYFSPAVYRIYNFFISIIKFILRRK